MTLSWPETRELEPRAVIPKTVTPMMRLLSAVTGPELRISIPIRASTRVFPEIMLCGAAGPISSAVLGLQRTSLPVTTVLLAPSRIAMPASLAQTSSPRTTVPLPPSSTMPLCRLSIAALCCR